MGALWAQDEGQKMPSSLALASRDQRSEKRVLLLPHTHLPSVLPSVGLLPEEDFSVTLLTCAYVDFRNPVVGLPKNPSTFVSQNLLTIH